MTVIGTLISERYRLEEKIGSGGMSSVYRAFDPMLERWVAIKLMHRDISHDPPERPLPSEVSSGAEVFQVIGAISGG